MLIFSQTNDGVAWCELKTMQRTGVNDVNCGCLQSEKPVMKSVNFVEGAVDNIGSC